MAALICAPFPPLDAVVAGLALAATLVSIVTDGLEIGTELYENNGHMTTRAWWDAADIVVSGTGLGFLKNAKRAEKLAEAAEPISRDFRKRVARIMRNGSGAQKKGARSARSRIRASDALHNSAERAGNLHSTYGWGSLAAWQGIQKAFGPAD